MASFTLPLDATGATLVSVGGKGLNLIRLTRAGFRVPPGFVITTEAYAAHVAANALDAVIARATEAVNPSDAVALEAASVTIRTAFAAGAMPVGVRAAILAAATGRERTPVAVRSSATAEDLPELSFAGQQDTYLNVIGPDHLLRAVVDCWSSLWTARAIGYRLRNEIPATDMGLAVVVQELVAAQASGVLFTADPLTGIRSHTVIDAVPGLGESLVSGQIEPDHWVIGPDRQVIDRTLGSKAMITVPAEGGGTSTVAASAPTGSTTAASTNGGYAITEAQAAELVETGLRVQAEYGSPQDIEWAFADGRLYVLQTRGITSLYPLPPGGAPEGLWFSFGAFQGMLRPITPIGREALIRLASGAAVVFAGKPSDPARQGFIAVAGERLWARVDGLVRHPIGARVLPALLSFAEPGTGAILRGLQQVPSWQPTQKRPAPRSLRPVLRFGGIVLAGMPLSLFAPTVRRRRFDRELEQMVADAAAAQQEASRRNDTYARLSGRIDAAEASLSIGLARAFPLFAPVMGPGSMMMVLLRRIGRKAGPEGDRLALEIMRSLPGNPTTEMDLALWQVAVTVSQDPLAAELVRDHDPDRLAELYTAQALPGRTQSAVEDFLATFGMRGVAEIDLGATRWRDDPVQVFATLKSYQGIEPAFAPDTVYAAGIGASRAAVEQLIAQLAERGSWPPPGLVWFLASRLRILFGAREVPKFTLVRLLGQIREGLLASGRDLVALGRIDRPEDVMFLSFDELRGLGEAPEADLRGRIGERRAAYDRELRRRQVPRLIAGDGHTWYEGLGDGAGGIVGSPVSPGVAEGLVRVVLDPATARLDPGEILVCPGTDPAWTPLFLAAAGLVTEVGGMMTHGSVVAREYGIPAVVGVHEATTRLVTGQRIRMDGSTGVIEVLGVTEVPE